MTNNPINCDESDNGICNTGYMANRFVHKYSSLVKLDH